MSWEVIRWVSGAVAASREFLLPVESGRWLRLWLLAPFVGTGWLAFVFARFLPFPAVFTFDSTLLPAVDPFALLAAVAGGLVLSTLALADPLARVAVLDALRYDRLLLSERPKERLTRAVRLLLFTLGAGALATTAAGTVFLAVQSGWRKATGGVGAVSGPADTAVTVVGGVVVLAVGVCLVGVLQAAAAFVPPAMVSLNEGAIVAAERVWTAFSGRRGTFLTYLLARLVLSVVVGLLGLVAAAALAGLLGVVGFVVLVAVFGSVAGAVGTVGVGSLVTVATLLAVSLVVLPVRSVTLTVLLTYDLTVLEAVAPDLALPDADLTRRRVAATPADLSGDTPIVEEPLPAADGESATDGGAEVPETGDFEFGVVDESLRLSSANQNAPRSDDVDENQRFSSANRDSPSSGDVDGSELPSANQKSSISGDVETGGGSRNPNGGPETVP